MLWVGRASSVGAGHSGVPSQEREDAVHLLAQKWGHERPSALFGGIHPGLRLRLSRREHRAFYLRKMIEDILVGGLCEPRVAASTAQFPCTDEALDPVNLILLRKKPCRQDL